MLATFIIGFHTARMDNLLQCLRFLARDHSEVVRESQLVTVCQNSCLNLPHAQSLQFSNLRKHFKQADHYDLELDCMQLPVVTNYGVDRSQSDKLIILESDRILPAGYFSLVIDQLRPKTCITTTRILKLSKPASDDEILAGHYEFKEDCRSHANELGRRNIWSGNTALCKQDYFECGRMDTAYLGYGWADSDMTNTMHEYGVKSIFREETELHLWHPPATYGSGDQKRMFIDNGIRFCKKWDVSYPDWFKQEIANHRKVLL